ncbi:uncharacterized protein LOC106880715 isoform X1 [Octopus bimaculoides]|uniref:Uncharacterized protein n=1 Tax=Octopus bimaculoides TaxID=37653 RepID=A0A0L8FWP3_OCTBM|nr:uncharacterized protein LOC106880715 isoform X1 [Octopus bimaculoides]|eukprot:XP_014786277.1 PREDICTED: uncharacterized protein LOC106880715 isoform X1 [Octopus bimaculoides]
MFLVAGSLRSFLVLLYTRLSRSSKLLAVMILTMASYTSTIVEIVDISPSSVINFRQTTAIVITCRYNVKNLSEFRLTQNFSEVVVKIEYNKAENVYKETIQRNGFNCGPIHGDKGDIICWKLNPNCEDATSYTCSSAKESSKPKILKVKPYMHSLRVVNPPIKANKISIFRCTAYVGSPFGNTDFVWLEKRHRGINIHVNQVYILQRDTCSIPAVSLYNYTVKERDIGSTSISCLVEDVSITKILDPAGNDWNHFGQTDNADKLCEANITKLLALAALLLFLGKHR